MKLLDRFLFIFIMLDFLSAYLFATLVVMSMEVLSGVTVYRSTRELHPPSTNSDATFDNFNPSPFHVLVKRKRNPWIKTVELLSHQPLSFPWNMKVFLAKPNYAMVRVELNRKPSANYTGP